MFQGASKELPSSLFDNRTIILQIDTKVKGRYNIINNIPSKKSKSKMKSDRRHLSLKFLGQIFEKSEGV